MKRFLPSVQTELPKWDIPLTPLLHTTEKSDSLISVITRKTLKPAMRVPLKPLSARSSTCRSQYLFPQAVCPRPQPPCQPTSGLSSFSHPSWTGAPQADTQRATYSLFSTKLRWRIIFLHLLTTPPNIAVAPYIVLSRVHLVEVRPESHSDTTSFPSFPATCLASPWLYCSRRILHFSLLNLLTLLFA